MAAGDWKDMIYAIERGDLAGVRYHLEEGVDPNFQHAEYFGTALITSIEQNQMAIAEYLLDNGADPNLAADFSTDTPLNVARRLRNKAAVEMLRAYGAKEDWLDWFRISFVM